MVQTQSWKPGPRRWWAMRLWCSRRKALVWTARHGKRVYGETNLEGMRLRDVVYG